MRILITKLYKKKNNITVRKVTEMIAPFWALLYFFLIRTWNDVQYID